MPLETPRGFTGHEHLDKLGLIHMNGRVYDPVLGRFLSADPTVQFPENTQSFNRYSYALNNPLSATDPSGFGIFKKIGKFFKKVFKKIFTSTIGQIAGQIIFSYLGGAFGAAIFSGLVSWANGGSLGDIVAAAGVAYAAAWAFKGVGDVFGQPLRSANSAFEAAAGFAAKTMAHGAVAGVFSAMRGGNAVAGFVSGVFGQVTAAITDRMPGGPIPKAVVAAVAGGGGAKLGGGKFKNGAITGAFQYLFNAAKHELKKALASSRRLGLYITGHHVGSVGPVHTAIEYVPEDGSDPHWLSAGPGGPGDELLVSGADHARPTDAPGNNFTIGAVTPPPGLSAGEYYEHLLAVDASYCDCADYDVFPAIQDSYNSNSYVTGLIGATGGTASVNFGDYYGGNDPLPWEYFGSGM